MSQDLTQRTANDTNAAQANTNTLVRCPFDELGAHDYKELTIEVVACRKCGLRWLPA